MWSGYPLYAEISLNSEQLSLNLWCTRLEFHKTLNSSFATGCIVIIMGKNGHNLDFTQIWFIGQSHQRGSQVLVLQTSTEVVANFLKKKSTAKIPIVYTLPDLCTFVKNILSIASTYFSFLSNLISKS